MGIKNFLLSRTFFKHLAISIAGGLFLLWISLKVLGVYTNHGESIAVPGLIGVNLTELSKHDFEGDFEFLVIDSIYDDHFGKGSIVQQDPPPGSNVKSGRKIYLTVVASQPETVLMPDLVDLSLRQALGSLKAAGLRLEKLDYVSNMAKNAVLDQRFEGATIAPETEILKGSAIVLVMGKGLRNETIPIPMLIGRTETDAIAIINQSSFNVGHLHYTDVRDKMHSRVYNQQPAGGRQRAEYGTVIDLWFKSDFMFNFDSLLQTISSDTRGIQEEILESQNLPD
jgi:eukaryotic-like serine/threonine-protein kinase